MATTVGFKTSRLNFDAQDLKRRVCKIHAILQSNLYWFHMQRKHRKNKFFFHSVVDWQPLCRSLQQLDMMIIA